MIVRLFTILAMLACAFFVMPQAGNAADVSYTSVQERSGDAVKLRQTTLGGESWFLCYVSTRACEAIASTTPLPSAEATAVPSTVQIPWNALPSGSSRVTVSPDGRYIAFYIAATQTRGMRTFGVLDTQSGRTYTKDEVVSYWDLLTEGIRVFAFSPDSQTLIYINDIENHPTLYRVNLASLSGTALTSTKMFTREYSVADVQWKDAQTILFIANRESPYQWALYEYGLLSGGLKKVADKVSYAVTLQNTGSHYLFAEAATNGVRPKVYDPVAQATHDFALPAVAVLETPGKEVTTLTNGLSGVFLLESSGNSDTLLVWLHGGPFRQASLGYHPYLSYNGYDWALELARRADVGVLKIDYPGSMGYGRVFAESVTGNVGVKDATDTAAAVQDFARRNGYTNVYLMGNSYGGYLAMKMLVDNPARYRGVMSIGGVADWTTLLTALSNSIFNVQFGGVVGDENDNYGIHAAASIYNKLGNLSGQKVVLVHAESDQTIPYRQAEGLANYMRSISKPVELITLEGEDHVFKKKESFERLCQATLLFVGKTDLSACVL